MKKKLFRKKDYDFKQHKLLKTFVILFLFISVSALAFFSQKPDNSFASTLSDCQEFPNDNVKDACYVWYSKNPSSTSMTYEWIANDSSCSFDTVTIKQADSGQVQKYLCSMAFTGNNSVRANTADYETTDIDTGSLYFDATGVTITTHASDKNSWSAAVGQPIYVDADSLKASVANKNIIGSEKYCAEHTMTSMLDVSTGGGGHRTPSNSALCVEVENQPAPEKIINNDPEPQPQPTRSTETFQYQEIYYAKHEFGPIHYDLSMGIEKLHYDSSTPKYKELSSYNLLGNRVIQTSKFKSEKEPADFYPSEKDPIITGSIAGASALEADLKVVGDTLKNSIKSDMKICGKANIEDAARIGRNLGKHTIKLIENYLILKENASDESLEENDPSIIDTLMKDTSIFIQAFIATISNKEVQKEMKGSGNAAMNALTCNTSVLFDNLKTSTQVISDINNSKPTISISEGIVYLNPGDIQPITSYAYIPSTEITYTFYIKYTKSYTTTIEYVDGILDDKYKTLDNIVGEFIGYEKNYGGSGGDRIKSDTRYIRRLGNIYGTSFTTKLKSIETKNGANSLLPKKPESNQLDSALVTARAYYKDGEDYENDDEKSDSKTYGEKVFAGSDHKSSIVATFQHAATARSNSTISDDAICENTMSKYDIDWWIDGKLITTENANILSTKPFNLEKNNKNGNGCNTSKNPLEVAGSNVTTNNQYSSLEIKNTENLNSNDYYKIPLGTFGKEYSQGGRIASQYDMDGSKTLQPSKNQIKAEVGFKVYRPWNYKLSIPSVTNSVAESNNGYLLAGEGGATITVTVKNEANKDSRQEGNPSYSPNDTKIELFRVAVAGRDDLKTKNESLVSGSNIGGTEIITITEGDQNGSIGYAKGNEAGSKKVTFKDEEASSGAPGSHVCYYARINYKDSVTDTDGSSYGGAHGYGTPSNNYVYSGLTCFTLIGFPTAQIWGGNVFSAGSINTRVFEGSNYALGSWADYGIISRGNVLGLASGKTLPEGNATPPVYNCQNHPLTVNNSGKSANPDGDDCIIDPASNTGGLVADQVKNLGNSQITAPRTLSKLRNIYGNKTGGTELNSTAATYLDGIRYSCYDSGSYTTKRDNCNDSRFRYTSSGGDLDLAGDDGKLPSGITHVIYATGNITINTNLTYESGGGYTNLYQIPQYIIIANGDIKIGEDVTEVNAWLIADADGDGDGELNTCVSYDEYGNDKVVIKDEDGYPKENDYNMEVCGKNLTINGPVFANKVMLRRTSGSTKHAFTSPAEKFDLTPLSYYWAFYQASQAGRASTVYSRNLPPRL